LFGFVRVIEIVEALTPCVTDVVVWVRGDSRGIDFAEASPQELLAE